jgi:GTPase SAR1 family protein
MKIITADERLAERSGVKALIVGPSGIGKTTLLRTLSAEMLAETLLIDVEAGELAVRDLTGLASIRPRTWSDCVNIACAIGGPNPALPATSIYSEAHHAEILKDPVFASLAAYKIFFVDSVTAASRLSFIAAEQAPEAVSDRGRKDLRAVYGVHARSMLAWLGQLQHARESTVIFVAVLEKDTDSFGASSWQPQIEGSKVPREIPAIVDQIVTYQLVDFGDRKPVRAFVCTNPNAWGYPAKDRSGRLEQFEPPDLGALLEKLTRPGKRKLLTVASPEQSAQT